MISLGCIDQAAVEWRELVRRVPKGTTGLILAHNHPSGDPTPSADDLRTTKLIQATTASFDLILHDHVVTNGRTFFSIAGAGLVTGLMPLGGDANANGLRHLAAEDSAGYPGLSPWERVAREDLPRVDTPQRLGAIAAALRQASPSAAHVLFVGQKNNLLAVERVGMPSGAPGWEAMARTILRGAAEEGATGVMLDLPADLAPLAPRLAQLKKALAPASVNVIDALGAGMESACELHLLNVGEDTEEYGQAVGI